MTMDEKAAWKDLPPEEHDAVWDQTERNFWLNFDEEQRQKVAKSDQVYQVETTKLKVEMGTLTGKHNELSKTQERLARELIAVEEELAYVRNARDDKADRLTELDTEYRETQQERLETRQQISLAMTNFFREKRGLELLSGPEPETETVPVPRRVETNGDQPAADPMEGVELTNGHAPAPPPPPTRPVTGVAAERLVDVVDADDNVIGPVERIDPWNQWVEGIQDMPIRRQVKIRRGRRFSQDHLASIYERSEAKGVKWLSCMIQAIGEVQTRRCQSCDKNQGAFENCIIVGGELFPKCGNCEWNRQGCHGASRESIDVAAARQQALETRERRDTQTNTEDEAQRVREAAQAELERQSEATRRLEEARRHEAQAEVERRLEEKRRVEEERQARQRAREQAQEQKAVEQAQAEARLAEHRRLVLPTQAEPGYFSNEERNQEAARQAMEKASGLARSALLSHPVRPTTEAPSVELPPMTEPPKIRTELPRGQPSVEAFKPSPRAYTPAASPKTQTPLHSPKNREMAQIPNGIAHDPRRLPTPLETRDFHATPGFTPANISGFTPANFRSRPPSHETPTPTVPSVESSPQPPEAVSGEPLEEITRENLILRDNGSVYTTPDCMYGVPLEKVERNHWYWDPSWPDVKSLIEPQWEQWRVKYDRAVKLQEEGKKGGSSKYQIGRQVNRGNKIFEFLDHGEISPYQLLGRSHVQSGKGGITSYDTLFRLSETLSELSKFKLDIKPVEWMRHRLWELMEAEGSKFNLSKTVHDFYHDPKLSALRHKHGFKNIGRPSGMGVKPRQSIENLENTPPMKMKRPAQGMESGTDTPGAKKRKGLSQAGTPREQSPLVTHVFVAPETPASAHLLHRKPAPESESPGQGEESVADYSDADSLTGASLNRFEFRIYQIKTRLYTTSPRVTQYWTWLDEERILQHQVLRDMNPVQWNVHREPINFTVNLEEVDVLAWNRDALRAHLVMSREAPTLAKKDGKPRGDVMVSFKRERTLTRFAAFCEKLQIKTFHVSGSEINERWDKMASEQLGVTDEDATAELRE